MRSFILPGKLRGDRGLPRWGLAPSHLHDHPCPARCSAPLQKSYWRGL